MTRPPCKHQRLRASPLPFEHLADLHRRLLADHDPHACSWSPDDPLPAELGRRKSTLRNGACVKLPTTPADTLTLIEDPPMITAGTRLNYYHRDAHHPMPARRTKLAKGPRTRQDPRRNCSASSRRSTCPTFPLRSSRLILPAAPGTLPFVDNLAARLATVPDAGRQLIGNATIRPNHRRRARRPHGTDDHGQRQQWGRGSSSSWAILPAQDQRPLQVNHDGRR